MYIHAYMYMYIHIHRKRERQQATYVRVYKQQLHINYIPMLVHTYLYMLNLKINVNNICMHIVLPKKDRMVLH